MKIRQSQRDRGKREKVTGIKRMEETWEKKKQEGGMGGMDEQVRSLAQGGVRKVFGWEEEEREEGNMLFSICWKLVCSTCSAGMC